MIGPTWPANAFIALACVVEAVAAQPREPSTVHVIVIDPSGARVAGARIRIETKGRERSATTDPRGEATLSGAAVAAVRIRLEADGFAPLDLAIKLKPGE